MSDFGGLLRAHRQAVGLTIEELSHASGVSVRAIGDMERGVSRGPQRRTVAALAEVLRLAPGDHDALVAAAKVGRPRPAPTATGVCELPRGIGDFTGRAHELRLLRELATLDTAESVTVTLWGGAGMGKSTLAVHAAGQLGELYPDGRHFVDLRGMDPRPLDSSAALTRLLKAFGLPERHIPADPDERASQYRSMFATRRCLVILDNAASEAQVRPLLPGNGPGMTLVTSRRPLAGLEGMRQIPLAPLAEAEAADLLRVLVGEARAVAEPDAVEELARLCGHLPLAMRIAGNRLQSRPGWTVRQLSARLGDEERRLDHLSAGDLHVGAAFALSYEQLGPAARRTFRWLALAAAPDFGAPLASVLTQLDLEDAEDALEELADLGLLQSPYPARYRFHDLVRLYSRARLVEEEPAEVREAGLRRMESWLLEIATVAGRWFEPEYGAPPPGWTSLVSLAGTGEATDWLQTEGTAWLEALRSAARRGEHSTVVEVAESMHWFSDQWIEWGHWREVFELSSAAAHAMGDKLQECIHLNYLSWALTTCEGRPEEGEATALRALELAREIGDIRQQAWAYSYASWSTKADAVSLERKLGHLRRSAELFLQAEDFDGYPQAMTGLITVLRLLDRVDEALEHNLTLVAALRDPSYGGTTAIASFSLGVSLGNLGGTYLKLERWEEAMEAFRESLVELRAHPMGVAFARSRFGLGTALRQTGRRDEARAELTESIRLFEQGRDPHGAAQARAALEELNHAGS